MLPCHGTVPHIDAPRSKREAAPRATGCRADGTPSARPRRDRRSTSPSPNFVMRSSASVSPALSGDSRRRLTIGPPRQGSPAPPAAASRPLPGARGLAPPGGGASAPSSGGYAVKRRWLQQRPAEPVRSWSGSRPRPDPLGRGQRSPRADCPPCRPRRPWRRSGCG